MTIFKLSSLGIAIFGVACGGNVDDGTSTMDNGGANGNIMSTGGSQRGGAAPAAGGSTQTCAGMAATGATESCGVTVAIGGNHTLITPAGGSTQVNVITPSGTGGLVGTNYTGGLTPVTFDTENPVQPNTAIGCGREFRAYNQSSCTYAVSLRTNAAGGFDSSSSVEVIYSVSDSVKSALLIGQSQPNCLQGDGLSHPLILPRKYRGEIRVPEGPQRRLA